jgi:hypothetical protein
VGRRLPTTVSDEVGQDVLGVVEFDAGKIRRVAGDVGDNEAGWF